MKLTFLVLSTLLLISCGSDSSSNEGTDEGTPTEEQASSSSSSASADYQTFTYYFGQNGNLYKPAGDSHGGSPGNLVVLFSSAFSEQFDSCETVLNTGETAQLICINNQPWTQIPYSCFTNGNRQTWRANFKCSSVAEVKITCYKDSAQYVFTLPAGATNQVCSRH